MLQEEIHRNQQLTAVITTNLSPLVPASLYENCVKYNIETPLSLAVQCRKTFQDMLNILKSRNITNKSIVRLCYLIAIIHSIITIRGKFAPNGFIRDYNYTPTDVE